MKLIFWREKSKLTRFLEVTSVTICVLISSLSLSERLLGSEKQPLFNSDWNYFMFFRFFFSWVGKLISLFYSEENHFFIVFFTSEENSEEKSQRSEIIFPTHEKKLEKHEVIPVRIEQTFFLVFRKVVQHLTTLEFAFEH